MTLLDAVVSFLLVVCCGMFAYTTIRCFNEGDSTTGALFVFLTIQLVVCSANVFIATAKLVKLRRKL